MNSNMGVMPELTKKQEKLLAVLNDPLSAKLTNVQKAELAGMNEGSYYRNMKNPLFLQAIRVRGLQCVMAASLPIVKRVTADALKGKFMQQKLALEMSGHYSQAPMIQQVIANINKSGHTDEELDRKMAEYMCQPQDVVSTSEGISNKKGVTDAEVIENSEDGTDDPS